MNKYDMIDRLTKRIGLLVLAFIFFFRDGIYQKVFHMVRDEKEETS